VSSAADPLSPADAADGDPAADRQRRATGRRHRGAIAHNLGIAILSGDYLPGDTLPGEIAAAGTMDVSRTSYREALQTLTAKGLVESRPKSGTKVLPRERWNLLDPDVLAWAFSGTPDFRLVRSLFELRAMIEPGAARLAAQRRDRNDLRLMKTALGGMRRHTLATEEGRRADREFHAALLRATRNDALAVLSASVGAAVRWTTMFKQRQRVLLRDPIPDHVRVFDAIADSDPDAAAAAMTFLVELALEDTRAALQDQPFDLELRMT
jgi:DNA-binding FadR family transcriptional regulator